MQTQATETELQVCPECGYVFTGKCANPACFPGLAAYRDAVQSYETERDTWVKGMMAGKYMQLRAVREIYERQHERPNHEDYQR